MSTLEHSQQARDSIILTMGILGAALTPRSVAQNVDGGEEAFEQLLADGLIEWDNEGRYYHLSPGGRIRLARLSQLGGR